jgi:hypothetical protein
MSQAAEERDAVERHFARSILALLPYDPPDQWASGHVLARRGPIDMAIKP